MKTTEMTLDLQAFADGELDAARRPEIERVLASDAEAKQMVAGLRQISELVRAHEPQASVPASREFYWSQIQRRIEAAQRTAERPVEPASSALGWLRWLVPALGAATVAVVVSLRPGRQETPIQTAMVEGAQSEASSVVFRSESDGVTIHWIN
jgi:anti-sigma factor RsiW